nr:uncharacterized protein LOC129413455 [Misgurnus anguillicaudatus]
MMEFDEENIRATRPKRHIRPPVRLQDFEVQYVGGRPVPEPVLSSPWDLPSRTTPFQSFYDKPDSFHGDPTPHSSFKLGAAGLNYAERSEALYHQFPSTQSEGYPEYERHRELQAIHKENAQLIQSRQAFHADLMELKAVRTEVKELVTVAKALKAELSTAKSRGSPSARQDSLMFSSPSCNVDQPELDNSAYSDQWPKLPPWPEPEPGLQRGIETLQLTKPQKAAFQSEVPNYSQASKAHPSPAYCYPPYSAPNTEIFPPPPTPDELGELFSPSVPRSYLKPSQLRIPVAPPTYSSTPAQSNHAAPEVRLTSDTTHLAHPSVSDYVYRGPTPTIPKFTRPDPSEFARLRIALENLLPPNGTELFKYQILVDHLKLDEAKLIADAYLNSPFPFTDTMRALHEKYGQPHQLALRKIAVVLEMPDVKRGDIIAFQKFSLQVQSLVGLLKTLGPEGDIELQCGSHVASPLFSRPIDWNYNTWQELLDATA